MPDSRGRVGRPAVAKGARNSERATGREHHAQGRRAPAGRESDWSILMARGQDGDKDAYRRLLKEVTPYLRSLVGRRIPAPSDIEDVVQDVLLTIHATRQTYDPSRPFGPWLVAVANRRLVDRLRRDGRLRSRETAFMAEHETFSVHPANLEEELSGRHELEAALGSLPPGQRQAIRLLKLEGMTLKEAAAATGTSVAALKAATHRALKTLRRLLTHPSEDP